MQKQRRVAKYVMYNVYAYLQNYQIVLYFPKYYENGATVSRCLSVHVKFILYPDHFSVLAFWDTLLTAHHGTVNQLQLDLSEMSILPPERSWRLSMKMVNILTTVVVI